MDCSSYLLFAMETSMNGIFRGCLYTFGLAYCFLGLSAITSRFFQGMEKIVQQTVEKYVRDPRSGRVVSVKRENLWNFTVADITLLAFGTSFPQISLAIIDALRNLGNVYVGGVGPGTLVGSAACDLFLIHAMCIIIPKRGLLKKVMDRNVWAVELVWSLWAYVWLYIIVLVWTPGVITIWEAGMTVLQFFLLVLHAYAQDQGWRYISISILDCKKRESWISSEAAEGCEFLNPSKVDNSKDYTGVEDPTQLCCGPTSEIAETESSQSHVTFSLLDDPKTDIADFETGHGWIYTSFLWKQQFYDVFFISENQKKRQGLRLLYEILAFPWVFLFSFVPPPSLCHGWITFLCSLVFITGISYVVTKLTELIGCVTGISSYVIALTVLATGTSWPDLAASMIAAYRQSTADSAIANITCSNSVNIFIGIGLPWLISSTYNRFVLNDLLRIPSLQLGFILVVYFITSLLCIAVLVARRYFLGGELGGPRKWAWASCGFILLLWVAFLLLSCLRIYNIV